MYCKKPLSLSLRVRRDNKMIKAVILFAASVAVAFAQYGTGPTELRAIARLVGQHVQGNVTFTQLIDGKTHIGGIITGLPAGQYGFHVHEKGDITGGCASTGSHYNPQGHEHGHPHDMIRHVGDLGNVVFNNEGYSQLDFIDAMITLQGPYSIIGRGLVLHERADDFGRTQHPDSRTTGNAGGRVACGVIGIMDPPYGWSNNSAESIVVSSSLLIYTLVSIFVWLYV